MFAFKVVAIVFCSIALLFDVLAFCMSDDDGAAVALVNTVVLTLAIIALACSF